MEEELDRFKQEINQQLLVNRQHKTKIKKLKEAVTWIEELETWSAAEMGF